MCHVILLFSLQVRIISDINKGISLSSVYATVHHSLLLPHDLGQLLIYISGFFQKKII